MRHCVSALAAVAALATGSGARGSVITIDFTGTVTQVVDNLNFALNGTVPTGTMVTGSLTYDTATPGFPLASPYSKIYYGTPTALSVDIGGGLLAFHPTTLDFFGPYTVVQNDNLDFLGVDRVEFVAGAFPPTGLVLPAGSTTSMNFAFYADLRLRDSSGTALSDQSLPTSLDLGNFTYNILQLFGGEGRRGAFGDSISFPGEIDITLTSLTTRTQAVPEPSTLVSSGLAALGLMVYRVRRQQTA